MSHDSVLIVDFGSQVTQLIARRVREAGVYCEIHPFSKAGEAFARLKPKAVILSGGPASVPEPGSPRAPQEIFESGVPILAICYGQQTLCEQLGGKVESGHAAEFGRADVEILESCALFDGVWRKGEPLSGVDEPRRPRDPPARRLPRLRGVGERALRGRRRRNAPLLHDDVPSRGGRTRPTARSSSPISCTRSPASKATGRWRAFRDEEIARIRAQVGKARVICGLSGGVDSAVAAVLIHEAIGDQLDLRLRRSRADAAGRGGRGGRTCSATISTSRSFMSTRRTRSCGRSQGVEDPEAKRKTIGRLFIDVFDAEARRIAEDGKGRSNFWRRARSIPT